MKILFFIGMCLLLLNTIQAQDVVLSQNPESDTIDEKEGPNKRFYSYPFFGIGEAFGPAEATSSNLLYGRNATYTSGTIMKIKLAKRLAVCYTLEYGARTYNFEQTASKRVPDSLQHNSEKIRFYQVGTSPCIRINVDKRRGNYVGYFIDLGGYINWHYHRRYIAIDKVQDNMRQRYVLTNVNYLNNYDYGVYAQIGLNKWMFFCNYRLSDVFKSSFNYAELSRFTAGMRIGVHK